MMHNVLPVLHGSMYKEPQTLTDCYNTMCKDCAYQLLRIDKIIPINKANCEHKVIMYWSNL